MYFKIITNPNTETYIATDPKLPSDINFSNGRIIESKIEQPLIFILDSYSEIEPQDYFKSLIPVMSKRFVTVLQKHGMDNIQLFPAILRNESGDIAWTDYYAVNIVGKVSCANMDKSGYESIGGGVVDFDTLILDYEKAQGLMLFRLAEQPSVIIINGRIIDDLKAIDKPKFRGVSFRYLKDSSEL